MTETTARCPVVRINDFDEALRFDRSRSIANAPEMFAGVPSDPVDGEINVREACERLNASEKLSFTTLV